MKIIMIRYWLFGVFTSRKRRFEKAMKEKDFEKAIKLLIMSKKAKKEILQRYENQMEMF